MLYAKIQVKKLTSTNIRSEKPCRSWWRGGEMKYSSYEYPSAECSFERLLALSYGICCICCCVNVPSLGFIFARACKLTVKKLKKCTTVIYYSNYSEGH